MSSSVITPAKPPYSSTTQASCRCPARSRSSTVGSGSVSGTSSGGPATARDRGVCPPRGRHPEHVGDAGHADQVVQVGAAHREPGVAGVQQLDQPADRLVGPYGVHVHPGHHGLAGGQLAEVEPPVEQVGHLRRRGCPSSRDSAMICSRSSGVAPLGSSSIGSMPTRRSSRVAARVEEPDHRPGDGQVDQGGPAQRPGQGLGAGDGQVLRGQLAEHHLHDGGDDQGQRDRQRQADAGRDSAERRAGRPAPPQVRLGDVTDQQGGDGDAELGAGEHEGEPAGDLQRPGGGARRRRRRAAGACPGRRRRNRTPGPRSSPSPPSTR